MSKVAYIAEARAKRDSQQLVISGGYFTPVTQPTIVFNKCWLCDREYMLCSGNWRSQYRDGLFVCPKCTKIGEP